MRTQGWLYIISVVSNVKDIFLTIKLKALRTPADEGLNVDVILNNLSQGFAIMKNFVPMGVEDTDVSPSFRQ